MWAINSNAKCMCVRLSIGIGMNSTHSPLSRISDPVRNGCHARWLTVRILSRVFVPSLCTGMLRSLEDIPLWSGRGLNYRITALSSSGNNWKP